MFTYGDLACSLETKEKAFFWDEMTLDPGERWEGSSFTEKRILILAMKHPAWTFFYGGLHGLPTTNNGSLGACLRAIASSVSLRFSAKRSPAANLPNAGELWLIA